MGAYFDQNGLAAQYKFAMTNAIAAEGRCKGKMSKAAYEAACEKRDQTEMYPTPEERLDYWLKIEIGLEDDGAAIADDAVQPSEQRRLFDLAADVILEKTSWRSGETVSVWKAQTLHAYIKEGGRDGGGLLYLWFSNGQPTKAVKVTAGHLDPLSGWQLTLTEQAYEAWAVTARALLK